MWARVMAELDDNLWMMMTGKFQITPAEPHPRWIFGFRLDLSTGINLSKRRGYLERWAGVFVSVLISMHIHLNVFFLGVFDPSPFFKLLVSCRNLN